MEKRNPYAVSFGRIPNQYISRSFMIDNIIESLDGDVVTEQAFKLTGTRGSGKTVTLSAIEKRLRKDPAWIVIDLKSNGEIVNDLIAALYESVPFLTRFIDANLNLTSFGISVNLSGKRPASSSSVVLKKILTEVQRKKKKVLIAIDEIRKTNAIIDFIQEFQILMRAELPVYLIVAGLYDDIESVENTEGLTFFLRATKYEMTPLNISAIREDYRKTLNISYDVADEMAVMTKGYAFAYQAFGKYMWDSGDKEISAAVLSNVDDALAEMVYEKIWSELSPRDRWFLQFVVQKDRMKASELLEITKKKHNEWSEPRKKLIEKGVIDGSVRGEISLKLPRMKEFVEARHPAAAEDGI